MIIYNYKDNPATTHAFWPGTPETLCGLQSAVGLLNHAHEGARRRKKQTSPSCYNCCNHPEFLKARSIV